MAMRIQNYPKEYDCMAVEKKNKFLWVRIMQDTKGAWLATKKKNNYKLFELRY